MDDVGGGDGTGSDGMSDGASSAADGGTGVDACEWEPGPIPVELDEEPAPECEYLVSTGEVAPVTVRITNDGDEVVHLSGPINCKATHFYVEDATDRVFPPFGCLPACEDALNQECGCLANCPFPGTIALSPGGSFEVDWAGFVADVQQATPECAGECAVECGVRVAPAPGPMRVVAALATELVDCGEPCECTPNEQGWCELPGYAGEIASVETTLEWPPACPTIELSVP